MMQMLDLFLLAVNGPVDQIPNRDHSHYDFILNDRKMTDAKLRHEPHALVHAAEGLDNRRAAHNLPYQRCFGRLALEDDLPGVIAFGENAEKPLAGHDEQSANIVPIHD